MMRSKVMSAALLAGSVAFTFSVPATSAPLMGQSGMSKAAPSSIETVQYYGYGHHHGHHYHGHHHHGGGGAGALIGGLAAGAIIGGAIAAGQANAAAQQNAAYCAQRYRSYDPASGTYLNQNGYRYPCP
jgi:hypothetical protein